MNQPPFIRENVPLADLTTFGIGGPARWLAEPATRREVAEAFDFAAGLGLPVLVLGGGSNLLVADDGVDAVVVKLSGRGEFGAIDVDQADPLLWRCGAAAGLQALVGETARRGVSGLEALAGIPGSVGGAAAMNSGGADGGLGRFAVSAEVFSPKGGAQTVVPPELSFGYRASSLRGGLALGLTLKFRAVDEPGKVMDRIREYRERKRAGQPLAIPSAGCVFRNPPGDSAGSLLDMAGCKGMAEGDAVVSALHANFIINHGRASARDVAALALRMRRAVAKAAGVELDPEVTLWGEEPAFAELRGGGA